MKENLARLVTKDSILKALENFEQQQHILNPSTKFDLIYKGNNYPPKEVVREAARIQGILINDDIHSLGGGDKTNKYLEDLGFKIVNKTNFKSNMNIKKLEKYWEDYKEYFHLPKNEHKEKYKWEILKQVYDKWDWGAQNKALMFKNAFTVDGPRNLWESGNFFPVGHTNWMFEVFEEETISQFNDLFDEKQPLLIRVKQFKDFYDAKLIELRQLVPDSKKINYHSHNDLRAIALYLTLQYPEKYFLFKYTMYKDFAKKLELENVKAGKNQNLVDFIDLSNEVLEFLSSDIDFIKEYEKFTSESENYDDVSLHLLTQDFIYTIANHFHEGTKYWRIGSNDGETSYFKGMLSESYIAIGWNEIGDLTEQEVSNRTEVQELLSDEGFNFGATNVLSRKAGEIFNFYSSLKIDDIVALMDGNTVLAIGKILSDYSYDEKKPFNHCRQVEWLNKNVSNFTISDGSQTSFYELTKPETIKKIQSQIQPNNMVMEEHATNYSKNTNYPLNQILFGAPGTGKTYHSKRIAVEIIDEKDYSNADRNFVLNRYAQLKSNGQIHFTTFHQSISYEDFIEGIKPITNQDNLLDYKVKDGIFKVLSNTAKISNVFDQLFVVGRKFEKWEVTDSNKNNVSFQKPQGGIVTFPIFLFSDLYKFVEANDIDFSSGKINADQEVNRTKYPFLEKYFVNGYESLHKYVYSKYLELAKQSSPLKYVLIIDEINRGNVSSVFGELITLLEEDKRLGTTKSNPEVVEVELPYSNQSFSVPDNLYLVGTMNSADRSVEALDTALRRRFSFIEMQPDPEILLTEHPSKAIIKHSDGTEVNLASILEAINQRIELLIDKDHQIGHSFFIKVKSFEELTLVFKDNIIPLLEEYFFGDFGKIGLVLGGEFIKQKSVSAKFPANFKYGEDGDTSSFSDKIIYEFTSADSWTARTFTSIYE